MLTVILLSTLAVPPIKEEDLVATGSNGQSVVVCATDLKVGCLNILTTSSASAETTVEQPDMLTVGAEQIEQLSRLKDLAHGWDDDEVAPAPSTGAITRALDILTEALRHGLVPFEVDADVLGGVALWYEGNGRRIWIACMNNGKTTALLVDGEQRRAAPYDADDAKGLAAFLMGGFG